MGADSPPPPLQNPSRAAAEAAVDMMTELVRHSCATQSKRCADAGTLTFVTVSNAIMASQMAGMVCLHL